MTGISHGHRETARRFSALTRIAASACLLLACDAATPPGPLASSIEIVSDIDTLTVDVRTAHLTAVVRDVAGNAIAGKTIAWSSTSPDVSITATGPLAATVTFSQPPPLVTRTVTASVDGASRDFSIVACIANAVGLKNSATLLVGRSTPLVAALFAVEGFPGGEMDVPLTWESSDPSVIAISDGATATPVNTGTAILTARACGRSASTSVAVVPAGYQITPIVVGGLEGSHPVAMNDSGDVLVRAPSQLSSQGFIWRAGSSEDLGTCRPRAINNARQVLCTIDGEPRAPVIWESGIATVRDTVHAGSRAFNDSGVVAMLQTGRLLRWSDPGSVDTVHLNPTLTVGIDAMNALGDVAGSLSFLHQTPFLWRGTAQISLGRLGRYAVPAAVNDAADVVSTGESSTGSGVSVVILARAANNWQAEVLRPTGPHRNDVASEARDLNNLGQIVGSGSQGPFVWESGNLTLLNQVLADQRWTIISAVVINNRRQILANAQRDGLPWAVILDPP